MFSMCHPPQEHVPFGETTAGAVVVVGAGPVGLTAALTLARRGIPVTLLEAERGPGSRSQASTFHPPTLDLLSALGVGEAMVARGLVAPAVQHRDRELGVLAEFDMSALAPYTGHPYRLQLEQREFTALADAELATIPICTRRYGVAVTDARVRGDRAELTVGAETIRAEWVIAADGAASSTRTALGLRLCGETYPVRYLTVKTSIAIDELLPGIAPVTYVSGGREGVGLLALRDHWRAVLRVFGDEPIEDVLALSGIQERLRAAVSDAPSHFPVLDAFVYPVHRRVAEKFAVGRIVLAGDAAHLNSPTGGMGMNSGIHDAYAYANAIADVTHGCADADAVQAVAAQRRRVALEVVGPRSDANLREIVADSSARRARGQRLARIAADPDQAREFLREASMFDSAPATR